MPQPRRAASPDIYFIPGNPCHCLAAVDTLLNDRRDGFDLGPKLLLNLVQVEAVVICDEVDSKAKMTEPSRTANPVKIGLGILREIKVDNDINSLDVDSSCEQVGGYKVPACPVPKIMKHAVAVALKHLCMDIKARVAELCDLLGEQLDPVHRVAEDYGLVDLELGEKCVETVELLLLLHKGIVLRDALQGELLHQVDDIRLLQEAVLELLHSDREGGRVQEDLALRVQKGNQLLDNGLELWRQQLVCLVHDQDVRLVHFCHLLVGKV
mmetsp:Transcript_21738/g.60442  ORF Transcript_21738/g.60442 Transcript_21738/m.60442 type:complete len:268 (+) Transcript_21738:158-961(+)